MPQGEPRPGPVGLHLLESPLRIYHSQFRPLWSSHVEQAQAERLLQIGDASFKLSQRAIVLDGKDQPLSPVVDHVEEITRSRSVRGLRDVICLLGLGDDRVFEQGG